MDKFIHTGKFLKSYVLCLIVGCLFSVSCDVCNGPGGPGNHGVEIFYTALPLNSEIPGIYAVSPQGEDRREIVKNGILYSQPSKNGLLAYLRHKSDGSEIRMVSIDGLNDTVLIDETNPFVEGSLSYPVLSSDGNKLAFRAGAGILYVQDLENAPLDLKTSKMSSKSVPSFSPDAEYIAYFENYDEQTGMKIKVKPALESGEIFVREFPSLQRELQGELRADWSSDGSMIMYSLRTDTSYAVFIHGVLNGSETIIEMDTLFGAEMPSFVKDNGSDRIAFSSKDGDIWTRNIDRSNIQPRRITMTDSQEFNRFAKWSPVDLQIIYHNYYIFDNSEFPASLFITNDAETRTTLLLSNNVYRGFWSR